MARIDDSGDDEKGRGSNAAKAISNAGHAASGGHVTGKGGKSKGLNQIFQDVDDDTGGDGPYVFVEYPKHVIVDGVTHTANDRAHEASIRAKGHK